MGGEKITIFIHPPNDKKTKKTSECVKKTGVREMVGIYTRVFEDVKNKWV